MKEPGFHEGKHYTEWMDTVKKLMRAGHLDEAVALLTQLIEAVESEDRHEGFGVAPWYYETLADVHRRRADAAAELVVLERFANQNHAPGAGPARLAERLREARSGT
jgi:hypothetical protein